MKSRPRRAASPAKRQITLTLPAASLLQAERIARTQNVSPERSEEVLSSYKKAFTGFSNAEMLALDGIWLEDPRERGQR